MTTWADFREAVRSAVVEASGLHDKAVVWGRGDLPNAGETAADPLVVLTVISNVRFAPVRTVLGEDGDDYTRAVSDIRDVAVQVRVDSIRGDALALADDMLLGLELQGPRETLEAECTVIDTKPPAGDLTYSFKGLKLRARAFELFLRIVLEKSDPTGVGTIGTVKVQGDPIDVPPEITLPEETISEE
jgi:hypothetical protein